LSHRRGWLRLGLLTIDEEVIAAQLWLVFGNTAYIYKLAYIKSFRNYSPGTILTNALVKHVIETDKVNKIDFLTGADSFKLDWMTVYRELLGVQIVNKGRPIGMLSYVRNTVGLLRKRIGE
jgi:CelD/BcsL family acetyltransferase involved in cellulose biosynthesis